MAAIATMESVIWPPLFKSDSFGDLSDLPQPISVSSDSVTHSNSSNDSDSSVMNDDSHSTSPLPESESMPISDNYFNLASPTTSVLSAISLSSSSSSSSSSLSGDESAVSIGLPMASALLPQRPLAIPSSSAVAMATSPASGAAPARVLKAIDRMKATRSRLESQRKYDIRRRGAARASLNDMRAILPAAEAVADAAEQILQDKVSDSNITIEVESDEKENNKAQDSTLSLPVHQLVRKTTKLIRSLTMAKEKLQLRLQDLECEDSEESQRSAKKARLNSTTTVSEQVQALLHVYSEVNRRYQADSGKLRQLLSSRPPGLADPTAALVEYVAMGMDGTILQDIARFPPDSPFAAACNAIVADAKQYGINFHDMFREPRLTQLHAIVHLYRKSFRYHTNGSSIKATDMQPEILLQMVAMSAPLPSSSSSSSSSSSALTAYSSSSASSPLSSSQSSAYEADCIRDSQLLSHPLGAYSLPAASFRHLQEVLSYLVSLSHSDYSALLAALRPLFASSFPSNRPSNDLPAFFELSPNGTRLRLRQAVMDERFSPSYEHLQAFHALYVENKPVVTLKKIGIPTKNGRMLYFDKDLFLIRCPTTGIPITHVSMPRKFYYNE